MSEPLFSVVVATYQRPGPLADCLQSLAQQHYPHDRFEVIVVDDDGGLSERAVREPLAGRLDLQFLQPGHGGPACARNTGAAQARGAWLYFVDDDCTLAPDVLSRLAAQVARHPTAAIAGACADAHPHNLWSAASQAQLDAVTSYFNRDAEHATSGASSHLAVPTAAFRALGGFDVAFRTGEDRDFVDRWVRGGKALVYAPEVLVTHLHPRTFRALWQRNAGYGRGAWQFAQSRRALQTGAPRVDRGFYAHLLSYPFRARHQRRVRLLAGMLVARAAYMYGYCVVRFALAKRQRPSGRCYAETERTPR